MKIESDKILLDHGSGGRASHELINALLYPHFENSILAEMDDGAVITMGDQRLAFSTDSYTVDPIFFPGGDIGELAVNGTVNDLAMCGAKPLYLSVGFIIEEGFPIKDLKTLLESMKQASAEAGVQIVTGDTKVVHRKAADKIFINTSGVGSISHGVHISGKNARPGDKVIVSGYIADHGITILTQREGLRFDSPIRSDTAPLNHMVEEMLAASCNIHTLRDPTRGGLATSLNEIAIQAGAGIKLYETKIPVRDETRGACELLGIDPLYIANEGKLIACVAPEDAEAVLAAVQANPYGKDAAVIGEVLAENPGKVFMETVIGGTRIIDMLTGEPLPRIC
jgi:hydrogenase expression/formation protein HypE